MCPVVTDAGIVLGRFRIGVRDGNAGTFVEEVLESGPTAIRPHTTLESIVERLRVRSLDSILVTTSDGRLAGTLQWEDAERREDADEGSCICDD